MALEGAGSTFTTNQTPVNDPLISGTAATSQLVTPAANAQVGSTVTAGAPVQPGLVGLEPGSTGTLTVTLYDQTGVAVDYSTVAQLDTDGKTPIKPTWTSSDTTNAPLTVADDGLSATITVPGNDAAGTPATITVIAALKNGTTASGTALLPITAPRTFSFLIAQS